MWTDFSKIFVDSDIISLWQEREKACDWEVTWHYVIGPRIV